MPSAWRGTITPVSVTEISIGIAAVSAIAAAASAFASYRAVALSIRPLVTAEDWVPEPTDVEDQFRLKVPLENRGPGTALNVRYRVRSNAAHMSDRWSDPVYALSPGGCYFHEQLVETGRPRDDNWFVETKFEDMRGAIWHVRRKSATNTDRRVRRMYFGHITGWFR
jgi:hypothetical protein